MPTFQAAQMLRVRDKQLWGRIEHYVTEARRKQDMSKVSVVGIDETSLRKGQHCVTVFHDLDAKRLLFATPGKDHKTVQAFAQDLQAHGGEPTAIAHACIPSSTPKADFERFPHPDANVINKLALQRQFFCSGT